MNMTANYHTHTYLCHHATGTQRDYIERAIEAGWKTIGFSDHVPMPFPDGHQTRYRVRLEDLRYYMWILENLREEYKDRIEILIGFEAEYYPSCFENMLRVLEPYAYDYLILGQHYVREESEGIYSSDPTDDPEILHRYVETTLEGLSTGKYTYFAHPDIINYTPNDDIYKKEMTYLCEECKKMDIPLEINILGLEPRRAYPSERFFKIAAEVGNSFVLGVDAHQLKAVGNMETLAMAENFAARLGITPLKTVKIRNPKG